MSNKRTNLVDELIPFFEGKISLEEALDNANKLFSNILNANTFTCEICKQKIPPKVIFNKDGIFVESNRAEARGGLGNKVIKRDICQKCIDDMIFNNKMVRAFNKIRVGLIFEDKDTVYKFLNSFNIPKNGTVKESKNELVYETSIIQFIWIKPFSLVCGQRLNFVFTTEDIRDSDWFDTTIRPCQAPIVGTCAIY